MKSARRHPKAALVFLIDVDNTLFDDSRVLADLRRHLREEVSPAGDVQYWQILQRLHRSLGYADYLGALQQYRQSYPHDPHVLTLSSFLIKYSFSKCLFPHALRLIKRCRRIGRVVILSDGDVVFQPHKIEQSGLAAAVDDHVLIYVHKEDQLKDIEFRYPADHYVVIDDNLRILKSIKKIWRNKVTTIWLTASRHGLGSPGSRARLEPDMTIRSIRDLRKKDLRAIKQRHKHATRRSEESSISGQALT
jgi:FMN phosphatase YigB (HAD superfamily)